MPRPRFSKLDPDKRDAILDAAASEFGDLGFERASYNRIIERAGLSKGAMYYYFDDKEDLFATVLGDAAEQMSDVVPRVPTSSSADAYWDGVEMLDLRLMRLMTEHPRVAALVPLLCAMWRRVDRPASLDRLDTKMRSWLAEIIAAGRTAGAVRGDVPDELLISVLLAVGEALDNWVMRVNANGSGPVLEEVEKSVPMMVDMLRRVAQPKASVAHSQPQPD